MKAYFEDDCLTMKIGSLDISIFTPSEWLVPGTGFRRVQSGPFRWFYCGRVLWIARRR